jgi:hypothetical protein
MKIKLSLAILLVVTGMSISCRKSNFSTDQETIAVSDNGQGTGTTTWTSDKQYVLEGFVFVNDGQVLTIEAGTVIRAKAGQGENASALIIARGGKIIAKGSPEKPIIFTSEGDDLEGSVPLLAKGLWGGVIILGNATINAPSGESFVEGIPLSEARGIYGGSNDNDNSGILNYVSIRHGGTNIGNGNEINGLTLAGVGNQTLIEYVEVVSNADDGFEFFGGTVNTRFLISAYNGDNAFDYDEGFRGYGQFWLAIQESGAGNQLGEHDGGVSSVNGLPYSLPVIYNATYVGRGASASKNTLTFSRTAGGSYLNSIFLNQAKGVSIEYRNNYFDCLDQFLNGNLKIENNIFYNIASNDTAEIFTISGDDPGSGLLNQWKSYFLSGGNHLSNPGIIFSENKLHPIPTLPLPGSLSPYPAGWFLPVTYKGAFGSYNWTKKWSLLGQSGMIL